MSATTSASRSAVILGATLMCASAEEWPALTLDDGVTRVEIRLPDAEKGWYRGQRFDWSGMIVGMRWHEREYFSQLRPAHDPTGHDHGAGPCEEFGLRDPPGWDEAGDGGSFVKIGIGRLTRMGAPDYHFNVAYPIRETPPWTVVGTTGSVAFHQDLPLRADGWGYRYAKTVRLVIGGGVAIDHRLENTGSRTIATDFYSHAMLRIGTAPIASSYRLTFPGIPVPQPHPPAAVVDGTRMWFTDPIPNGSWTTIPWTWSDARVSVTTPTGGLQITTTPPPSRYEVYVEAAAFCPEPYIRIDVPAGGHFSWTLEYRPTD